MLFGLAPAVRSPSPETLTGGRVAGRRREWLRPSLVALQIALSLILLCGAALLMQSLRNMANAPLGMETSSLFSAYAQLPGGRYPQPAQRAAFWKSLSERLTALPGVEAIGIVGDVRNGGLTMSSDPEIYLLSNRERPRQYVLLRADTRVMPFVREAFRELDPRLTIQFETLDERVRNMRARPRFQSMLLGGFAVAG